MNDNKNSTSVNEPSKWHEYLAVITSNLSDGLFKMKMRINYGSFLAALWCWRMKGPHHEMFLTQNQNEVLFWKPKCYRDSSDYVSMYQKPPQKSLENNIICTIGLNTDSPTPEPDMKLPLPFVHFTKLSSPLGKPVLDQKKRLPLRFLLGTWLLLSYNLFSVTVTPKKEQACESDYKWYCI